MSVKLQTETATVHISDAVTSAAQSKVDDLEAAGNTHPANVLVTALLGPAAGEIARSPALLSVIDPDQVGRLAVFNEHCTRPLSAMAPRITRRRVWDDQMGISRQEGPVPIADLGPAPLDMHGRQPWQLVPPSWTNVQPGPSMVKFRTAYEAERSGFDAGFHRMQSRDKEQVGIWAARRVEEHLHNYVSWLAEGLSHTRAAADQAQDAPYLQSNRLEGPDDIAQADRPQWARDHPARLGFNNALLRSRDNHVGPYRVAAYPDLLGAPAPGAENGRRYRRGGAARRPPPRAPGRGDGADEGVGDAGDQPVRNVAAPVPRVWFVPHNLLPTFDDEAAQSSWASNVFVSRSRTAVELFTDVIALCYVVGLGAFVPDQGAVILAAPMLAQDQLKSMLARSGLDWEVGVGYPLAELGAHLLHVAGPRSVTANKTQVLHEDLEAIQRLEADRRFRFLRHDGGGEPMAPSAYGQGVVGEWSVHISTWHMRVAFALALVGTERHLVSTLTPAEMSGILPVVGYELAKWVDLASARIMGCSTNLHLADQLLKLGEYASLAVAGFSLSAHGGGLSPAILRLNFVGGDDQAAVGGNAGFRVRFRRNWSDSFVAHAPPVWLSEEIITLPTPHGSAGRFVSTAHADHRLRNALQRAHIAGVETVGIGATDVPQLEQVAITWHVLGADAPTDVSVVPLEAIKRIWASIRFERPVVCLSNLEGVIGVLPASASATAAVASAGWDFL